VNTPHISDVPNTTSGRRVMAQQSVFEKHAQSVLASLIVLALTGAGYALVKIGDIQTKQLVEMKLVQYQISELIVTTKAFSEDRVRKEDYLMFKEQTRTRLRHLEQAKHKAGL
tara:strand:- start:1497 stop:1835 length:339 start_codon:yes stop_codon:yes gene_type:complete